MSLAEGGRADRHISLWHHIRLDAQGDRREDRGWNIGIPDVLASKKRALECTANSKAFLVPK